MSFHNKYLSFEYSSCGFTKTELEAAYLKEGMSDLVKEVAASKPGFMTVLFDEASKGTVETLVAHCKQKAQGKPILLVVIGIGGSSLGAKALHAALQSTRKVKDTQVKIVFVETIDGYQLAQVREQMHQCYKEGHAVFLNVITKSGTTLETMVNFFTLLHIVQQYQKENYADFVIVTTDHNSVLHTWALSVQCHVLSIPSNVGGRYSVFTAVGLFPLALLGYDIDGFQEGARAATSDATNSTLATGAVMNALLLFLHYKEERAIHDTFLFSSDLEDCGKWYRQLVGESLGKVAEISRISEAVGVTPTVSLGTVDLHSVVQLYLSGPDNRFTTFITVENDSYNDELITGMPESIMPHFVNGKTIAQLVDAAARGTMNAYALQKRPFIEWSLPVKSEYHLAYWMQTKMIEIAYCAQLLKINPFDQPHVELYKKGMYNILKKSSTTL